MLYPYSDNLLDVIPLPSLQSRSLHAIPDHNAASCTLMLYNSPTGTIAHCTTFAHMPGCQDVTLSSTVKRQFQARFRSWLCGSEAHPPQGPAECHVFNQVFDIH